MSFEFVNPESMMAPIGFSHAVKTRAQTTLYIAGQVAAEKDGVIKYPGDIEKQFDLTLLNIKTVVEAAGATLQQIVKINLYVVDVQGYKAKLRGLGAIYRNYFGKHFPAMTMAGVSDLYNDDAMIEIEAVAILD